MEENRAEILFPFGGLNDAEAASDQPDGTTTEIVNMRPFDPQSGKRRGSQRAGMSKYSTQLVVSDASRVQALLPVTYDKARLTYTQLTTPTKEWEAVNPSFGTGYASAVDSQGSVYVLDGQDSFVKYSASGQQLSVTPINAQSSESIINRIAVDEFDSLYVALSRPSGSRVVKYEVDEERGYVSRWEIEIPGTLRDFDVKNDLLVAITDTATTDESPATSFMYAYPGISFFSTPTLGWSKSLPGPINGVSMNNSHVFYTAEPNVNRGGLPGGYFTSRVEWSPTEITNFNERCHFWFDASYIEASGVTINNGDRISESLANITARTDYETTVDLDDKTNRSLSPPTQVYFPDLSGNTWTRPAPQFKVNRFGQMPALVFREDYSDSDYTVASTSADGGWWNDRIEDQERHAGGGNVLVSKANDTATGTPYDEAKANVDSALPRNGAVIPGYKDQRYIFAIAGTIASWDDDPQIVFTMEDAVNPTSADQKHKIAFCINLNNAGTDKDEGKVTLNLNGNATHNTDDSTTTTNDLPYDLKAISPQGDFILVMTVDSGTRKCAVRLNGRAIDSFTIAQNTDAIRCESSAFDENGEHIQSMGRFILGGPTYGFVMTKGDRTGSPSGSTTYADEITSDDTTSYNGVPQWVGNEPVTNASSTGYLGYDAVGNPDTRSRGAATEIGNMYHFHGDICEIITVLANHSGGAAPHNDAAIDQPLRTDTGTKTPHRGHGGTDALPRCNSTSGSTEVEKIEGYLAHKWGMPSILPVGDTTATAGLCSQHPFYAEPPTSGGSTVVVGYDNDEFTEGALSQEGVVGKVTYGGEAVWSVSGGGTGYGIVADDDGGVYTVGPFNDNATNPTTGAPEPYVQARKLIDNGTTVTGSEALGAWTFKAPIENAVFDLSYKYPRLALDSSGNLYWPFVATSKSQHIKRLNSTDGSLDWEYSLDTSQQAYSASLPPTQPNYGDDEVTGPEYVYLTSDNGGSNALPHITKVKTVSAAENLADGYSSRDTKLIAVANGDIRNITKSTATTPSGGSEALNSQGAFVSAVSAFQKIYLTDGISYKVYDPKTDAVADWTATSAGEMPARNKLVTCWRGRMVLGRDPEDPHNWHMSAMGEPDNWDENPPVALATQAITGNNSRAGKLADVVNTFIPYSDDLLLFGCDSKIYRLTGDPMAGGQLDLVSEATGIAFGDSWCKDPEGVIYFFGSRGGVYAMTPTGEIQNISGDKIERRLQDVEFDRYRIQLVWNDREQGLHVIKIPYTYDGNVLTSWYWDRRHNAWFEDELTNASKQTTAVCLMDGDKFNDRALIFGCEDGYVRRYDERKSSDDGDVVHSKVLLGPITEEKLLHNYRFSNVQIELASKQSGASFELYGSRSPDEQGGADAAGLLQAGANGRISGPIKAGSAWIRLSNAIDHEHWGLEAISLSVYPAGRKRIR